MSLSYRKYFRVLGAIGAPWLVLIPAAAQGAQYYWQPLLEGMVEINSNRDLLPDATERTQGYFATVGSIFGVATPRSESLLRPEISYRDYSGGSQTNDLQGSVDLSTTYTSPRSALAVLGRAERADVYSSELADPRFNEVDPTNPTNPETGQINATGETRDLFRLRPTYTHQISQRAGLSLEGGYEKIDYSNSAATGTVDYDYSSAGIYPGWQATRRLNTSLGIYRNQYRSGDRTRQSDSTGVSLRFKYDVTQPFRVEFDLLGERSEIENTVTGFADTVTSAGARLGVVRTAPVSDLRLEAAHLVTPTGAGGLYRSSRLQVNYDRRFSERLQLLTAVLYDRNRALASIDAAGDVTYFTTEVALRWNVTRTWYLFGGYRYFWRDLSSQAAHNSALYAGIGYRGLGKQE